MPIFKGYFQLVEPLSHPLTYITPPDHRATFRNLQPCLPGETISLPLPLQRTSRYRAGDRHCPNRVPIYTLVEWSNVGWIFCSEKSQWSDEGSNSGPFGSKSNALSARLTCFQLKIYYKKTSCLQKRKERHDFKQQYSPISRKLFQLLTVSLNAAMNCQ